MILSDGTIKRLIATKTIEVSPLPEEKQYQPASLDLRLGDSMATFPDGGPLDVRSGEEIVMRRWRIKSGFYDIRPGAFVLGTTLESISLPGDLIARVEGRSTFGRLGLLVHATAGFIDPGFRGQITLEIKNIGPRAVRLHVGQRVCQLAFERMDRRCLETYKGKYQGQSGATAPRQDQ